MLIVITDRKKKEKKVFFVLLNFEQKLQNQLECLNIATTKFNFLTSNKTFKNLLNEQKHYNTYLYSFNTLDTSLKTNLYCK